MRPNHRRRRDSRVARRDAGRGDAESRCGTSTSRRRGSPTVGGNPTGTTRSAAIVARVALRYDETKADLIHDDEYEAVLFPLAEQLDVTALAAVDYDDRDLQVDHPADVTYALPAAPVDTKTYWTSAERDIRDHLVRTLTLEIPSNPALKLYGRPGETTDSFVNRCREVAIERAGREIAALRDKYEAKVARVLDQRAAADGRVDVLREQAEGKTQLGGAVDRRFDARRAARRPQVGRESARRPARQGRAPPPVGGAAPRRPTNA